MQVLEDATEKGSPRVSGRRWVRRWGGGVHVHRVGQVPCVAKARVPVQPKGDRRETWICRARRGEVRDSRFAVKSTKFENLASERFWELFDVIRKNVAVYPSKLYLPELLKAMP
ncbi:hypothetical protein FGB62_302g017 [Gracilaria domingensis]|nr:hypothetical protein FGB62_302g017 [Gracilaria domingensis]